MNAQHLAKQRCRVLGIAARFDVARSLVIGVSAVAARDIEIALVADSRAEADPATVMIVLRLVEGEQGAFARAVSDVGIGRDAEECDVTDPLPKRAARPDVIN